MPEEQTMAMKVVVTETVTADKKCRMIVSG